MLPRLRAGGGPVVARHGHCHSPATGSMPIMYGGFLRQQETPVLAGVHPSAPCTSRLESYGLSSKEEEHLCEAALKEVASTAP